jgi:hypothetical protein
MLNQVHQHDDTSRWMVTAWILSFMSLILIGFTVDYFGTLQPIMFFMLGAISWAKFYRSWDSDHPTENLVTHEIRANNTVITSNNLQD